MLILGVLAVLQMTFIPGWLFWQAARFETDSALQQTIDIFALSLLCNYGLVVILTLLHLYTSPVVYAIIILESMLLIYGLFPARRQAAKISPGKTIAIGTVHPILLAAAVTIMTAFVYFAAINSGEVFRLFDAVVSWNRWAVDWAHNAFPYKTAEYPQLIPANWSLAYVMIQNTDVQLFARALMPFFPLAIMLVMLDLTLKQQNNVGVLALVFYAAIMLYFYDPLALIDGYVDIAVSFFGLLTLSQVSSISTGSDCKWKRILLAGLFAAAAALTKQAGFFVLAVFLGWVLWLLITKGSKMGRTENLRIAGSILTVLLIVGTWYWAKEIQISKGADYSAVQLVTHDIYAGASLPQRLAHAAVLLTTARGEGGRFIFMLLSGIFGLGLFFRSPRRLIWLSLLYLLLWGIFFSYDTRNLTLIYPVTALIMAQGVTCAMNWWHRNSWGLSVKIAAGFLIIGVIGLALDNITNRSMVFKQLWPTGLALGWGWLAVALGAGLVWVIIKNPDLILRRRWLITGVAVLCIGLASRLYPPQQIIDSQLQKQQRVGIESLNVRVYEYQREHDIPGLILSDYIFLPFLPGLREKTVYRQWPQGIKTVLQQPDQIGALLISQPVLNEANIRRETSQRFILIFDHAGYAFMAARP